MRLTHLALALAGLALSAGPKSKPKPHASRKAAKLSSDIHLVRKGETAAAVARNAGLSLDELGDLNPGISLTRLAVGTRLRVKAAVAAPKPLVPAKPLPGLPSLPGPRARSLASLERLLPPPPRPAFPVPETEEGGPRSAALPPLALPPAVELAESIATFLPADPDHFDLLWPVETRTISSGWGPRMRTRTVRVRNSRKKRVRYKGRHRGLDLNAPQGTDVYAAMDGQVVTSTRHRQYGNYVVIDHGNGVVTLYAHHKLNLVQEGEVVHRGQKIAQVGRTGNATGPHLHFELRLNGLHQNPLPWLDEEEEIPADLQAMNALKR